SPLVSLRRLAIHIGMMPLHKQPVRRANLRGLASPVESERGVVIGFVFQAAKYAARNMRLPAANRLALVSGLAGWKSGRVDTYFKRLGDTVLDQWKRANFSLPKFPAIARALLDEWSPAENVDLAAFMREFLVNDEQPFQTDSGFGQPELVAYNHPR